MGTSFLILFPYLHLVEPNHHEVTILLVASAVFDLSHFYKTGAPWLA
jgi:hypothetical protein